MLHYLFDSNDIMPGFLIFPDKNFDTDFNGLTGEQIYYNDCSKKVKVYHEPYWEQRRVLLGRRRAARVV